MNRRVITNFQIFLQEDRVYVIDIDGEIGGSCMAKISEMVKMWNESSIAPSEFSACGGKSFRFQQMERDQFGQDYLVYRLIQ